MLSSCADNIFCLTNDFEFLSASKYIHRIRHALITMNIIWLELTLLWLWSEFSVDAFPDIDGIVFVATLLFRQLIHNLHPSLVFRQRIRVRNFYQIAQSALISRIKFTFISFNFVVKEPLIWGLIHAWMCKTIICHVSRPWLQWLLLGPLLLPFLSSTFRANLHLDQSRNFTCIITRSPSFRVEWTPVCCTIFVFGVTFLTCLGFFDHISIYKGFATDTSVEGQT